MECPSGTLAYGMTLFIPESVYWRDPDLGPPPISNAPMPVSVCLLCGRITEIHREGNREFETLSPTSTEIRNLPSYQVCIGKGQILINGGIYLSSVFHKMRFRRAQENKILFQNGLFKLAFTANVLSAESTDECLRTKLNTTSNNYIRLESLTMLFLKTSVCYFRGSL